MKRMMVAVVAAFVAWCAMSETWTDPNTGIEWTYTVSNGNATLGTGSWRCTAIPTDTQAAIEIPSLLKGYPVTSIGDWAFYGCDELTTIYVRTGDTARIKNLLANSGVDWVEDLQFVEEDIPEYVVVFNANGGSCTTTSLIVKDDDAVGPLPTATRLGYTFLGWFTAATASKVVATFTKKGEEPQTLEFDVAALPSGATGTFNGFVIGGRGATAPLASQVSSLTSSETVNVGSLQVTVSDVGKITAKVVAAAGAYSFTATGWDSANEGVYSVKMTTKKGDVLTLACDSAAAWNDHQLTGSFVAKGAAALSVEAQKNAFGKQWFFNAELVAREDTGSTGGMEVWTLSFAENAKSAALTVTLNADGKTSVAGTLYGATVSDGKKAMTPSYKITASGYADVSGIAAGAIFADFAPVISVKSGKTTAKKVLSLRANLWLDKKDNHEEGVGSAVFVP